MKKMIFTLALTLALTNGIASSISAQAAPTKTKPISTTNQDGGAPACVPGYNCVV